MGCVPPDWKHHAYNLIRSIATNTIPRGLGGDYAYYLVGSPAPQRQDESKASLSSLGAELIFIIVDMVYSDSPRSIKNLALVSSPFYHAAQYCLLREIHLNISAHNKKLLKKKLEHIERGGFFPAIRRVSLCGAVDDKENLDTICRLLRKATGLRDLEWLHMNGTHAWSLCVPDEVLAVIHSRSAVRLHTDIQPTTQFPLMPVPKYESLLLAGSENLHSLRMCFNTEDLDGCTKTAHLAKRILISSPSVRKLAIDVEFQGRRHTRRSAIDYIGLGFVDGERPSELEELEMGNYTWGTDSRSIGYPGKGHEIDYWVDTFDWSRLKYLKTNHVEFASKLAPKLVSLQKADIGVNAYPNRIRDNRIREFYESIPKSLSTIIIPKFDILGVNGIIRFSPTLKVLHIHQHQRNSLAWAEETIDELSLLQIRDECSLIEDLALDVARPDDWPYAILDILAGFAKLRTLTLWFELGYAFGQDGPSRLCVTWSAAEKLFIYINSKRPSTLGPLKELWVRCADPSPIRAVGHHTSTDPASSRNISNFCCRLTERDDEMTKGVFSMSCPGLTKDENALLERIRRGDDSLPKYLSDGLGVAIFGSGFRRTII